MREGRTLEQLARELTRQRETRRDFIVPTPVMHMETKEADTRVVLQTKTVEGFEVSDWAHGQIASHTQIPRAYYDRIRQHEKQEVRAMFDTTVNTLLAAYPEKRMVRTLDGRMRSFHSNKFRPYDNFELAEAILPALPQAGAEVVSCEVTEKKFYLKVISPRVTHEVKKGDIVQAGLVISNSEVGAGSLKVEPLLHRLVCLNGMIAEDASFRKNHAGKALGQGGDMAVEFYADDTRRQTDMAVFMQIRDIVRATLSKEGFRRIAERFAAAQDDVIEADAFEVIEVAQRQLGFREEEKRGILQHLIEGKEMNRFGLVNALTRYSQDVGDYDRATEFERMGGQVLEMKAGEWKALSTGTGGRELRAAEA